MLGNASGPSAVNRIRGCTTLLFCSGLILIILAILALVFAIELGKEESTKVWFEYATADDDSNTADAAAGIFTAVTVIAIALAFTVALCGTERCYNSFFARICVFTSFLVFWTISGVYMTMGVALVVPFTEGTDWIEESCAVADKTEVTGGELAPQAVAMFETTDRLDKEYQQFVNAQMFTELCTCPGNQNDPHYLQYSSIPEGTYAKYGRTFYGSLDPYVRPLIFQQSAPRINQYQRDPRLPQQAIPQVYGGRLTMKDCLATTAAVASAAAVNPQAQTIAAQNTNTQQRARVYQASVARGNFQAAGAAGLARPDGNFDKVASFFESTYKCAGFCKPSLFYYSQPVTFGVPTQACLVPWIKDIDEPMYNLGVVLITQAVILFLMIFCACPVCCYTPDDVQLPDMNFGKGTSNDMGFAPNMGGNNFNNYGGYGGVQNTSTTQPN